CRQRAAGDSGRGTPTDGPFGPCSDAPGADATHLSTRDCVSGRPGPRVTHAGTGRTLELPHTPSSLHLRPETESRVASRVRARRRAATSPPVDRSDARDAATARGSR